MSNRDRYDSGANQTYDPYNTPTQTSLDAMGRADELEDIDDPDGRLDTIEMSAMALPQVIPPFVPRHALGDHGPATGALQQGWAGVGDDTTKIPALGVNTYDSFGGGLHDPSEQPTVRLAAADLARDRHIGGHETKPGGSR